MNESEWLAGTNPERMFHFVREQLSERKLRLFAVACCRAVWNNYPERRSRKAVKVGELFADAEVTADDATDAANEAFDCRDEIWDEYVWQHDEAVSRVMNFADHAGWCASPTALFADRTSGLLYIAGDNTLHLSLMREIYGNPFRPVTAVPAWLTPTVVGLAEAVYTDRAFDRLPVLADALEEAGCDNADVLAHCRSDGPHVRGCWVVDLVTGRK